jgi:hypothetical protein
MGFSNGECIQDQYGYRYTLTIDAAHQYITGTVTGGQGGGPWILTGSYVQSAPGDPWIYELSVANANGTNQPGFVPVYKLKGVQPYGAWYYQDGFGGQEFTFTSCTAFAGEAEVAQEPLGPGERRGPRVNTGEEPA